MRILRTIWEWVRYFIEKDWTKADNDIKWQRLRADAELNAKRCVIYKAKKFSRVLTSDEVDWLYSVGKIE